MSLVGTKAPSFQLPAVVNNELGSIDSEKLLGKWTVLFFYPLDFTFVCPTEILAFSEAAPQFAELGAQVIGASVDSQFTHLAWINTPRDQGGLGQLNIPLVADLNKQLARDFGVLDETAGVALRGVFVIDPAGVVQSAIVNNLGVGRNVHEVLRTLKAFQYITAHEGEVCPAGWDEGADTMVASPQGVVNYLSTH
jgi:peroxiredoxin (alkyl hydroperoxide reductase subunit C)